MENVLQKVLQNAESSKREQETDPQNHFRAGENVHNIPSCCQITELKRFAMSMASECAKQAGGAMRKRAYPCSVFADAGSL
jgi:hypothetical protein